MANKKVVADMSKEDMVIVAKAALVAHFRGDPLPSSTAVYRIGLSFEVHLIMPSDPHNPIVAYKVVVDLVFSEPQLA